MQYVNLGGWRQWVLVRSTDTVAHPVLLFLHGGPGAAATPLLRKYNYRLEQHFTVVHWDQRTAGKSFRKTLPKHTLTLRQHLDDTYELVQLLRRRFRQDKIFLVGHSWGSRLGLYAIQEHPEWFSGFIGIGQEVAAQEAETLSYDYTVQAARQANNQKALTELTRIGPPQTGNVHTMYRNGFWGMVAQKQWLLKLGGERYGKTSYTDWGLAILGAREYSVLDFIRWIRASAYSSGTMLLDPAMHDFNFFRTIPAVRVPVTFVAGRHDYNTPWPLVQRYYQALQAPYKQFVLFEHSGHSPLFEEPDRFNQLVIDEFRRMHTAAELPAPAK